MDRTVREEDELTTAVEVIATVPQFAAGVLIPKRRGRHPDKTGAKNVAAQRAAQTQAEKRQKGRAKQQAKKAKNAGMVAEPGGESQSEPVPEPLTPLPNGFRPAPVLVECCRGALHHLTLGDHRVDIAGDRRSSVRGVRDAVSIGVTSCLRGEGRSTIAAGLAAALHQARGSTVILLELDLAKPSLAHQFGVESGPGVAEILRDGRPMAECLYMPDDGSAGLLVAGDAKGDPDGLFVLLRSSSFMQDLGRLCDVVVADLPPVLANGHSVELSELFNSVLLVVRTGTLPLPEIRRALNDLGTPPPAILNGVETSIPRRLRTLIGA
jgi:Mrp family chromosome partitioning ATPase